MFRSVVVHVTPTKEGEAAYFNGDVVRAWFLKWVGIFNPTLASSLHEGSELRPYTVSDFVGLGPVQNKRRQLSPERSGWVRLTTLSPELSDVLLNNITPALPGAKIDLRGIELQVDKVSTSQAEHSWAASASPQALVTDAGLASSLSRRLMFRYASPTVFEARSNAAFTPSVIDGAIEIDRDLQRADLPFPLPDKVFLWLLQRWNTFSRHVQLHPDTHTFAASRVVVSKYQLRSRYLKFPRGKGSTVGFTGYCRYFVDSNDRFWLAMVRTLALSSFFLGLGRYTTQGLGQVALWDEHKEEPVEISKLLSER